MSTDEAPGSWRSDGRAQSTARAGQLSSLQRADPTLSLYFPFPPSRHGLARCHHQRGGTGTQRSLWLPEALSGFRFQSPQVGGGAEGAESQSRRALVQCVNQRSLAEGMMSGACPGPAHCHRSQRPPCMTCTEATWASRGLTLRTRGGPADWRGPSGLAQGDGQVVGR